MQTPRSRTAVCPPREHPRDCQPVLPPPQICHTHTHTPDPSPCGCDATCSGCHHSQGSAATTGTKSTIGGRDIGVCRCGDIEVSQAQLGNSKSKRHKLEATQLLVAPGAFWHSWHHTWVSQGISTSCPACLKADWKSCCHIRQGMRGNTSSSYQGIRRPKRVQEVLLMKNPTMGSVMASHARPANRMMEA